MSKEKAKKVEEKAEKAPVEDNNLNEQFVRLQAEFANFRRRTEEERTQVFDMGASDVLSGVVEVLDDFELALKNAHDLQHFKKGMEMIYAKLVTAGEKYGMKRIETVGKTFDPTQHEALLTESSDKPENTIIEELQSGYTVKDKVIRTAKVKVSKK